MRAPDRQMAGQLTRAQVAKISDSTIAALSVQRPSQPPWWPSAIQPGRYARNE
ncbi:MAG TPA: hypothetical protein VKU77_23725 [Streptosporangiaceae bacterium]|nr:hypothetical protein [Streptosporangiaceae bacterium]